MKIDIYNTTNKYQIIYADPPWQYNRKTGRSSAAQHYATMPLDEIKNLPIKDLKTDDAMLFMWVTFPMLEDAFDVIKSWGFTYKGVAFVWVKKNKCGSNFWGMGQYTRSNAEVCLMAISKHTKASKFIKSHRVHQIIESIREAHSKKPDIVRDKIVELCGDISKIELFARQSADGWDRWGLEAPDD